jgi:exodeoxyribonuclease V alpha subunit
MTPAPLPHTQQLATLQQWADAGWLRRIDHAMACFVAQRDPAASEALVVATALLAHLEGRGHTCLPLAELLNPPHAWLGWPSAAHEAVVALWQQMPTDLSGWCRALGRSPLVRQVPGDGHPPDPDRGQPLVLASSATHPRLYWRRYWVYEAEVSARLQARSAQTLPVDTPQALQWMRRLFPAPPESAKAQPGTDWQQVACALTLRGRLTLITGGPGTGKTYTAARLLALVLALHPDREGLKVALAAPTGKAAARLKQSIETSLTQLPPDVSAELKLPELTRRMGAARTVHALLGARPDTRRFAHDHRHPLDLDLLIVDETSMVHLELMAALLQALPAHARLVMLGDPHQLASVEAGAVLGDLCPPAGGPHYDADTVAYLQATSGQTVVVGPAPGSALAQRSVQLQFSHRFGSAIGQLALAVNGNEPARAQALLRGSAPAVWQSVHHDPAVAIGVALTGRAGASACHTDYLRVLRQRPTAPALDNQAHADWAKQVLRAFEGFRMLCAVHEGPWGERDLNHRVQQALASQGWIQPSGAWYAGRPIMVTRNDPALGVFNGDVGVVLPSPTGALRAYFLDGDALRSVSVSRLAHVETAFAMTVHKSQGSEFGHTLLVLPPAGRNELLTRELVYTGITRARSHLSVVEGGPDTLVQAIGRPVQRASGLRAKLEAATL